MNSTRDPSSMTTTERLREVSELFATGYLRLLVARRERQIALADTAESEPHDRTVNRSEETEEVTT